MFPLPGSPDLPWYPDPSAPELNQKIVFWDTSYLLSSRQPLLEVSALLFQVFSYYLLLSTHSPPSTHCVHQRLQQNRCLIHPIWASRLHLRVCKEDLRGKHKGKCGMATDAGQENFLRLVRNGRPFKEEDKYIFVSRINE